MKNLSFFAFFTIYLCLMAMLTSCGCDKNKDKSKIQTKPNDQATPNLLRLQLTKPDQSWGKPIQGSSGTLVYYDSYSGQFEGRIMVAGLEPNHTYTLCLNEHENYPIGNLLPKGPTGDKFKNIFDIETDSSGNDTAEFFAYLNPGEYHIKFLLKDKTDWQIVLINDDLQFKMNE